ncbi:DNA-3-methyladenine glycosylase I [Chitinophagaceae bacterium MMS25-I14]
MCANQNSGCTWPGSDEQMNKYHDEEWGTPLHDDRKLFEFMVLDAFQAGLNWKTILHKRKNFEKAFAGFNIVKVSKFTEEKIQELMQDTGIIRNQLKIRATVNNAQRFIEVQKEFGSFDKYIWQFTGGRPLVNRWKVTGEVPPRSAESDAMSKDLQKRGFKFVGSTICYAFMQAAGMINDHLMGCPRHKDVQEMK